MLRPLGMLVFGLGVIVAFIRMHGDGYPFPDKVAQTKDSFPIQTERDRPDAIVLETSILFPEEPDVILPDEHAAYGFFVKDEVPIQEHIGAESDHIKGQEDASVARSEKDEDNDRRSSVQEQHESNNNHHGWNTQWHLGRKRKTQQEHMASTSTQVSERGGTEQPWVWMARIYHGGDTCSPGLIHQYGRPLKSILHREGDNKWELLYTHKLPGSIIHTSVSRRLVPLSDAIKARRQKEKAGDPASTTRERMVHDTAREVIRLGMLYKVVRDETAIYYLRVYHFGRFQPAGKPLQDDCGGQTSECHQHDPFVFFDYELPGSMPFKDFTLEHDTIVYTRANDPYVFRYIQLPQLRVGSTSSERPHKLPGGNTGPKQACDDILSLIYRTSVLAISPKASSKDKELSVLVLQVHEDSQKWTYDASVFRLDSNDQWTTDRPIYHRKPRILDTEPMYDDSSTYTVPGFSKPDAFIVHSLDRKALYLPYKNIIYTLGASGESRSPPSHARQGQQHLTHDGDSLINDEEMNRRLDPEISGITSDMMDPDMGALSDDKAILALKTKRNGVVIVRQDTMRFSREAQWEMTMVLSDDNYFLTLTPERYKREVRAMRIIQVPQSQLQTFHSDDATVDSEGNDHSDEKDHEQRERREITRQTDQEGALDKDPLRHVLLMAFGNGNLVAYNLDEETPSSSTWTFIQEKYQVVIGMLAVVIVFVINEAR